MSGAKTLLLTGWRITGLIEGTLAQLGEASSVVEPLFLDGYVCEIDVM